MAFYYFGNLLNYKNYLYPVRDTIYIVTETGPYCTLPTHALTTYFLAAYYNKTAFFLHMLYPAGTDIIGFCFEVKKKGVDFCLICLRFL